MGTSVQADAKFLRRIFLGLVFLTLVTGGMAGLTTVQAMTRHDRHLRDVLRVSALTMAEHRLAGLSAPILRDIEELAAEAFAELPGGFSRAVRRGRHHRHRLSRRKTCRRR